MNVLPKLTKSEVREVSYLMRGAAENINSQGGVLVPEEVANLVISRRNLMGRIRNNARVAYMGSDVMVTPRRTTDVAAGLIGENLALPESTQSFDGITLVARKIGALTRVSSELDQDQVSEAANDFITMLAYGLAKQEDIIGFKADGSSTYLGMKGLIPALLDASNSAARVTAVSGHGTFDALTVADLGQLIGIAPDWALAGNPKWYCSPYCYAACFAKLGATAGNNVGPMGMPALNYLGFEVVLTSQLPGNTTITGQVGIIFGDLSLAATLGSRRELRLRRLDERFADADQVGFVVTERVDFVVHDLPGVVGLVGG
jgi:HK97 family phage major capsid protein